MTRIVIIVDEKGVYQNSLADSESDIRVLRRGDDDAEIEACESEMEEVSD